MSWPTWFLWLRAPDVPQARRPAAGWGADTDPVLVDARVRLAALQERSGVTGQDDTDALDVRRHLSEPATHHGKAR